MPTYNECQLRIHRDNPNTQWGFRLQGGKEFNAPLTVQRVFIGSPSAAQLQRGDVLVAIDNNDVSQATQRQAMEFIKSTGSSLSLRVRRPGHVEFHESCTPVSSFAQSAPQSQSSKPFMFQIPPKPSPLTSYETAMQSAHVSRPNINSMMPQYAGQAPSTESTYSSQFSDFSKRTTYESSPAAPPPPAPPLQNYRSVGFAGSSSAPTPKETFRPNAIQSPPLAHYSPQAHQHTSSTTMDLHMHQHNHHTENTPPVIYQDRSANEDEEETYKQKSVKDIKQMFNKSKQSNGPAGYGGQQHMAFNKFQPTPSKAPPPVLPKTKQSSYGQPLSPPSNYTDQQLSWNSYSQPAAQKYPQSINIQQHQDKVLSEGGAYGYKVKHFHLPPKATSQPAKPCTTPNKTGKGPYGKKEFDPEQSAVYRMLMEEDKPKKSGGPAAVQSPIEQEPERFQSRSSGGHSDRFRQLVKPEDDQSRDEPVQSYGSSHPAHQQSFIQQQQHPQPAYGRPSAYGGTQHHTDVQHQTYSSKSQLSFSGSPQQPHGGSTQQSYYGGNPQQSYSSVTMQSHYGSSPQQSYSSVTQQSHYGSTPQYSYGNVQQQQSYNVKPQYSSFGGDMQQKSQDFQSYGISDF